MAAAVEKSRAMYDPRSTMFPKGAPVLMQTDRATPVSRDRKLTPEPRAAGSLIEDWPRGKRRAPCGSPAGPVCGKGARGVSIQGDGAAPSRGISASSRAGSTIPAGPACHLDTASAPG